MIDFMSQKYRLDALEEAFLFAVDRGCFGPRTIENLFPDASFSENIMSQLLASATGLVRKKLLNATAVQYGRDLQGTVDKIVYKPVVEEFVEKDSLLEITTKGHQYLQKQRNIT